MRELLRWLLGLADKGSESSSDVARRRMRLVLIQDRIDLSPDKMDQMKQEIWEVVSRYMVVDDEFLEFEVRRFDELVMLVSHIEVKDLNALVSARSA